MHWKVKEQIHGSKPPFPGVSGLFGKPSVVNNVETLCNVPHIIANGAEWFKGLSISDEGGTKIYGASGRVKNPGFGNYRWESHYRNFWKNMPVECRTVTSLKACLPGGGSTDFLTRRSFGCCHGFCQCGQSRKSSGNRYNYCPG